MATETLTASANSLPLDWSANSGTRVDAVATAADSLYITPDSAPAAIQFATSNPTTIPSSNVTIPYVRVTANLRRTSSAMAHITVGISDGTNYLAGERQELTSTTSAAYTWDFEEKASGKLFELTDVNSLEIRLTADASTIECDKLTASVVFIVADGTQFQYEKPTSWDDAKNGGYCSMTGMWAPAPCLVDSPGGRFIREYAPMDEVEQIERIRPRTGKTF